MFDRYLVPFTGIPHFLFTAALALVVAFVVASLGKRTMRERLLHAVWFCGCSVAAVIAGSWIMFLIHG